MKYLKTFEAYTNSIPKSVQVQNEYEHGEGSLMDKNIDKEITDEEKEEEIKSEEEKEQE